MSITNGDFDGIRFECKVRGVKVGDYGVGQLRRIGSSADGGAAGFGGGKEGAEVAFAGSGEARGRREEERFGEEEVRRRLQCCEAIEVAVRTC